MILLINYSRIFYFTDKLWSMLFKAQHFWSILTLHFLTHYVFVNPKRKAKQCNSLYYPRISNSFSSQNSMVQYKATI